MLLIAENGQLRSFEQTDKRNECASFVKIIASIEDPAVINQILAHLNEKAASAEQGLLPESRAPPQADLFEEPHHSNYRLL
jgi:hypothetical protein